MCVSCGKTVDNCVHGVRRRIADGKYAHVCGVLASEISLKNFAFVGGEKFSFITVFPSVVLLDTFGTGYYNSIVDECPRSVDCTNQN